MVCYIQLHGAFVLHQTGCAYLELVHIVAVAASHEDLDVSTTLIQDHGKQLPIHPACPVQTVGQCPLEIGYDKFVGSGVAHSERSVGVCCKDKSLKSISTLVKMQLLLTKKLTARNRNCGHEQDFSGYRFIIHLFGFIAIKARIMPYLNF